MAGSFLRDNIISRKSRGGKGSSVQLVMMLVKLSMQLKILYEHYHNSCNRINTSLIWIPDTPSPVHSSG